MDAVRVQRLIPELYALVAQLEEAAPGRSFAPDGHLLGSIGEAIAASPAGVGSARPGRAPRRCAAAA